MILAGEDATLNVTEAAPSAPWMMKADAFCYADDCEVIKLYRYPEAILNSIKRTPFMYQQGYTEEQWKQIIEAHHKRLRSIPGMWINTDLMLLKDEELKAAIEHCGGTYEPNALKVELDRS